MTAEGYELRAATTAEVDAHFARSRPAHVQTPERDLTVTAISALSEIGFGDWKAFGVKAANVAGRKLRYIGRERNRAWLELTAAAYNLVRLSRLEPAPL